MSITLNFLKKIISKINDSNSLKKYNKGTISTYDNIKNSIISGNVNCLNIKKIEKSIISGNINIGENIEIKNSEITGSIKIGDYCRIISSNIKAKKLRIGNFTSIWGPNIFIYQQKEPISIGNFCSIAKNVTLQEYNHNKNKVSSYFIGQNIFNESWDNEKVSNGSINILNDVWIGEKSTVLGGVTIGNGAIIGAGSIVTKDIPDYAIAVGSPAKIIGYRFSPEIIEKLNSIEWWNWDLSKIKKNKAFFEKEVNNINSLNEVV